jgi:hypothetical protein
MSLVETGYSSDEDIATDDVFGLSKLNAAKKPRVESANEPTKPSTVTEAAPHVLSEVRAFPYATLATPHLDRTEYLFRTIFYDYVNRTPSNKPPSLPDRPTPR